MKKIITLFILYFCLTCSSFSWDSTAAKFYPLAIGNTWSYHHINFTGSFCVMVISQYDIIKRIVGDTLMPNGKRYFKFNNGSFERIDSSSMNVYKYYAGGERIIDSLFAVKGDYFTSYRSGDSARHHIFDTIQIVCFDSSRPGKIISGNGLIGHSYTLVAGFGLYREGYCEFGGSTETLNGCIINGIQYGQIIGIKKNEWNTAIEYSLSQNYPNPFNPVTKIKFSLPLPSQGGAMDVKLLIYDILGREIANLIPPLRGGKEGLQPDTYEVEWDASNYPSGVYFYQLSINNEQLVTKKMILLK